MPIKMSDHQAALLARLFSPAVIRDFCTKKESGLFASLLRRINMDGWENFHTVAEVFDPAFKKLSRQGSRTEYVYRAVLTNKILLGRHNLKTASIVNELRVGSNRADSVIFNGTSTAYEIKSERDSLERLSNQIESYKNVFATVCVVVAEKHIREVISRTEKEIGILSLNRKNGLTTHRIAQSEPSKICPVAVLDILRTEEALEILSALQIEGPLVPNTLLRAELRKIFALLPPEVVHSKMISVIKTSRRMPATSEFISSVPISLRAAALPCTYRASYRTALVSALSTPMEIARHWR